MLPVWSLGVVKKWSNIAESLMLSNPAKKIKECHWEADSGTMNQTLSK